MMFRCISLIPALRLSALAFFQERSRRERSTCTCNPIPASSGVLKMKEVKPVKMNPKK